MRLITSLLPTILLACSHIQAAPPVPPPKPPTLEQVQAKLLAKAALLVDPLTGDVLYARNIDAPYPPASTVKLMTALVAYEKMGGRGTVTIAPEDTRVEPSTVPLRVGETVPTSDLYRSIIIGSDNDSAMAPCAGLQWVGEAIRRRYECRGHKTGHDRFPLWQSPWPPPEPLSAPPPEIS